VCYPAPLHLNSFPFEKILQQVCPMNDDGIDFVSQTNLCCKSTVRNLSPAAKYGFNFVALTQKNKCLIDKKSEEIRDDPIYWKIARILLISHCVQ
jgi:hypothetical protein